MLRALKKSWKIYATVLPPSNKWPGWSCVVSKKNLHTEDPPWPPHDTIMHEQCENVKLHENCMKSAWKLHEIIMKSAWILHEYFYRFGCVVDICWKQHENNIASQNLTTSSQYHHSNMSSAFSSRFCFLDWPIARKSSACILVNKRYSRTSVSWWSIHHKDNSVDHTNT